ncbi:MAG: helix-turn-helix transcriptional regulator [Silvanigrellaceae bacterium]|nr:helix-turn-helix transcriptional regulator [Silvanigrellaceae bacterium]
MDLKYDTPTLLYSSLMDETLKSLMTNFNVNFFHFARRIKNTNPFSISTDREWHLKYKQDYESNDTFMDVQKIKKYKNVYLWGSEGFQSKKEKMMHEERTKSFCIPPGISLIDEGENFIDTYSFSSSMIFQDRINILLNQSNDLFEFGIHFSKEINPIVSSHFKKKSISVKKQLFRPVFRKNHIDKNDFNLSTCSSVSDKIHNSSLFTTRQMECIYCTANGLTSAQTSMILNISKRTVESILNAAIIKMGCANRYQLIYQATKYGLIVEDIIPPLVKLMVEDALRSIL